LGKYTVSKKRKFMHHLQVLGLKWVLHNNFGDYSSATPTHCKSLGGRLHFCRQTPEATWMRFGNYIIHTHDIRVFQGKCYKAEMSPLGIIWWYREVPAKPFIRNLLHKHKENVGTLAPGKNSKSKWQTMEEN
jgi:hypothetical protein